MWGSHRTTWRHYKYLNEKGFDCVTFNLLFGSERLRWEWHPDMKYIYKGVFYVWTRQIRSVLNFIEGDKILFGFSGPSLSAFWASHGRNDISAVICDGGPFHRIYSNTRNFFYYEVGIKNKWLNKAAAFFGSAIWGYKPIEKLHKVLRVWPRSVPVLSIRGIKDNIVAIRTIRKVFKIASNVDVTTLELEYGKHLDGMRDFPDQYTKTLLPFLKRKSTLLD